MKKNALNALAVMATFASFDSLAVTGGVDPRVAPLINPWNSQQVHEWKFVGSFNGQSAVQIAPSWILFSDHNNNAVGAIFTNANGQSSASFCPLPNLCRLSMPIPAPNGMTFPPMVESPPLSDRGRMSLFGLLLGVGNGGGFSAAWSELDGIPFGYMPASAAAKVQGLVTPSSNLFFNDSSIPLARGGDSGGAMYWYSSGGQPALMGILERAGVFSKSPIGNYPFTPAFISQVRDAMIAVGDTPVAQRSIAQHSPADVLTPPFINQYINSSATAPEHTRITWSAPTAPGSATIDGYLIELATQGMRGDAGAVIQSFTVASTARAYDFNGLTAARKYIACVMPKNAAGAGSNMVATGLSPDDAGISTGSCKTFQAGVPPSAIVPYSSVSLVPISGTSNYSMSASWPPVSYGGPLEYRYYIKQELPGGGYQTIQQNVNSTSFNGVGVFPAGVFVCLNVVAVNAAGVEGGLSNNVCLSR